MTESIQTAADRIAHLESGGLLATGDPDHVRFLRYERYRPTGSDNIAQYLGVYGWASALVTPENELMSVLRAPQKWVKIDAGQNVDDHDAAARPLLEQIGEYVDLVWQWTVQDARPANNGK